jgi:hypothetical protein
MLEVVVDLGHLDRVVSHDGAEREWTGQRLASSFARQRRRRKRERHTCRELSSTFPDRRERDRTSVQKGQGESALEAVSTRELCREEKEGRAGQTLTSMSLLIKSCLMFLYSDESVSLSSSACARRDDISPMSVACCPDGTRLPIVSTPLYG